MLSEMGLNKIAGWIQIALSVLIEIISFNFVMEANIVNNDYIPYNLGILLFFLGILTGLAILLQGIVNVKKFVR